MYLTHIIFSMFGVVQATFETVSKSGATIPVSGKAQTSIGARPAQTPSQTPNTSAHPSLSLIPTGTASYSTGDAWKSTENGWNDSAEAARGRRRAKFQKPALTDTGLCGFHQLQEQPQHQHSRQHPWQDGRQQSQKQSEKGGYPQQQAGHQHAGGYVQQHSHRQSRRQQQAGGHVQQQDGRQQQAGGYVQRHSQKQQGVHSCQHQQGVHSQRHYWNHGNTGYGQHSQGWTQSTHNSQDSSWYGWKKDSRYAWSHSRRRGNDGYELQYDPKDFEAYDRSDKWSPVSVTSGSPLFGRKTHGGSRQSGTGQTSNDLSFPSDDHEMAPSEFQGDRVLPPSQHPALPPSVSNDVTHAAQNGGGSCKSSKRNSRKHSQHDAQPDLRQKAAEERRKPWRQKFPVMVRPDGEKIVLTDAPPRIVPQVTEQTLEFFLPEMDQYIGQDVDQRMTKERDLPTHGQTLSLQEAWQSPGTVVVPSNSKLMYTAWENHEYSKHNVGRQVETGQFYPPEASAFPTLPAWSASPAAVEATSAQKKQTPLQKQRPKRGTARKKKGSAPAASEENSAETSESPEVASSTTQRIVPQLGRYMSHLNLERSSGSIISQLSSSSMREPGTKIRRRRIGKRTLASEQRPKECAEVFLIGGDSGEEEVCSDYDLGFSPRDGRTLAAFPVEDYLPLSPRSIAYTDEHIGHTSRAGASNDDFIGLAPRRRDLSMSYHMGQEGSDMGHGSHTAIGYHGHFDCSKPRNMLPGELPDEELVTREGLINFKNCDTRYGNLGKLIDDSDDSAEDRKEEVHDGEAGEGEDEDDESDESDEDGVEKASEEFGDSNKEEKETTQDGDSVQTYRSQDAQLTPFPPSAFSLNQ